MEKDKKFLNNIAAAPSVPVELPNGKFLHSCQQGEVPISDYISETGKNAMILKNLNSSSLLSLGQLCDDGCLISLSKQLLLAIKIIK